MGLLKCTKCGTNKPATMQYFPPHNKKKNGLDSWCRKCRSAYRQSINRGRFRNVISDEDLIDLKSSILQCVICGSDKRLVVDHCHTSNGIRGILCSKCNCGLGMFNDDPELLEFARIYLLSYMNSAEADEYLDRHGEC